MTGRQRDRGPNDTTSSRIPLAETRRDIGGAPADAPPIVETRTATVDTPIVETRTATVDTPIVDTRTATVDIPIVETDTATVDTPVVETDTAMVDTPIVEQAWPPVVERAGWKHTVPGGLLRAARPRQWIKNVLVFAAPGAAGLAITAENVLPVIGAFVAWCLVSSGTYLVNDASDVEADRLHPRKRLRAVASGVVPVPTARVVGVGLLVLGAGAPAAWGSPGVSGLLALYAAITLSYSLWLKEIAIIDLAAVASGFVLRAISGGVAADVPISDWFLIVASFGSLFIVAGKRHAEHVDLREGRGAHRSTLEEYSLGFLGYVRSVSSGVAIAAYCLWAFEKADVADAPVLFQLSIIPFVLAILRYALLLDAGRGGAPEEVVIGDRPLQLLGLAWVALFTAGVYAA